MCAQARSRLMRARALIVVMAAVFVIAMSFTPLFGVTFLLAALLVSAGLVAAWEHANRVYQANLRKVKQYAVTARIENTA